MVGWGQPTEKQNFRDLYLCDKILKFTDFKVHFSALSVDFRYLVHVKSWTKAWKANGLFIYIIIFPCSKIPRPMSKRKFSFQAFSRLLTFC